MKTGFKSLFPRVIANLVILNYSKYQSCYFNLNYPDNLDKFVHLFANSGVFNQIQKGEWNETITFQK